MASCFETERLILRQWQDADIPPFADMNQSEKVMQYFPKRLTRDESQAMVDRIKQHFMDYGFGLYAVERKDTQAFIGFVGLNKVGFSIPALTHLPAPVFEIGWRLDNKHWAQGFAFEAAKVVLEAAFNQFHLDLIVSFTAKINLPSIGLMQKLGLTHQSQDDFNHPVIDVNSPLSAHVLYKKLI